MAARRAAAATAGSSRRRLAVSAAAGTYSGKEVNPPAKGHHFLHIDDFSREELRECGAPSAHACNVQFGMCSGSEGSAVSSMR